MYVVLSGFRVSLLCFVQEKTLCRYDCMYLFSFLVLLCEDVMVMSSAYMGDIISLITQNYNVFRLLWTTFTSTI